MNLKSIRWQLPISYAAIALLAALALGAVMLATLDRYYNERERAYLHLSAKSIQASLAVLPVVNMPRDLLKAQLNSLAFLSQSRIRVYDHTSTLLADSGSLGIAKENMRFFSIPVNSQSSRTISGGSSSPADVIILQSGQAGVMVAGGQPQIQVGFINSFGPGVSGSSASTSTVTMVPAFSPFSIVEPLGQENDPEHRSRVSVEVPLLDQTGQVVGTIDFSEGPAFGWQIVSSVARAWAAAAVLAVLLAGAAGFFVSHRISRPVTALADATLRMAEGDLSARAAATTVLELNQLSESFNHMAERIQETILALRRFAADAAHELKTPLTALQTNLELISDESDPARRSEFLRRAVAQVTQLDRLMGELLHLSRIEAGDPQAGDLAAHVEAVDLLSLARRVSEVYAARAEQAGITYELSLPEMEVVVPGRPAQLELALSNLLDNALKFTSPGGWIRLQVRRKDGLAELTVEDSGIGFLPEDLPAVFGRFHRGRNASGYPGSGLGLAIVQAVAHAHGGEAKAENGSTCGARLTLRLTSELE